MAVPGLKAQALAVEVATRSPSQRSRATLVQWSPLARDLRAPCGMSSWRCTCRSSATLSRRSWHPRGTPIRLRCGRRTHWPYSRMIRRTSRRSRGDVEGDDSFRRRRRPPRMGRAWTGHARHPGSRHRVSYRREARARRAQGDAQIRPRYSDRAPPSTTTGTWQPRSLTASAASVAYVAVSRDYRSGWPMRT